MESNDEARRNEEAERENERAGGRQQNNAKEGMVRQGPRRGLKVGKLRNGSCGARDASGRVGPWNPARWLLTT